MTILRFLRDLVKATNCQINYSKSGDFMPCNTCVHSLFFDDLKVDDAEFICNQIVEIRQYWSPPKDS